MKYLNTSILLTVHYEIASLREMSLTVIDLCYMSKLWSATLQQLSHNNWFIGFDSSIKTLHISNFMANFEWVHNEQYCNIEFIVQITTCYDLLYWNFKKLLGYISLSIHEPEKYSFTNTCEIIFVYMCVKQYRQCND